MPLKPTKRGYKMWVRACANGYVSQFEIYTGNKTRQPEIGLGERVVKDLCKTMQGKSFKIYADNYFSSLNLAKNLLDNGIGYCGTIRCNRKNLPQMKEDTFMSGGDMDYRMTSSGISCCKWMDKKAALIISSIHDPTQKLVVSRKQKDGFENFFLVLCQLLITINIWVMWISLIYAKTIV